MSKEIKIGDVVRWISKSRGVWTEKDGVVMMMTERYAMEHFPYWHGPLKVAQKVKLDVARRVMFDGLTWGNSGVIVEVRGGKTGRAKPKLHMPNRKVEKVEGP